MAKRPDQRTHGGATRRGVLIGTGMVIAAGSLAPGRPAFAQGEAVRVPLRDLNVQRGRVMTENPSLARAVKEAPKKALEMLRERAPSLRSDQISVDRSGRVIIDNPEYARAIQDLERDPRSVKNGACGFGC